MLYCDKGLHFSAFLVHGRLAVVYIFLFYAISLYRLIAKSEKGSKTWPIATKKRFCSRKLLAIIILLAMNIAISSIIVMLNNAWVVPVLIKMEDKINEQESELAADDAQLETLLRQFKEDSISRIIQLENSHTTTQGTLNATRKELSDLRTKIFELEIDHSTTVRALQEALDATEMRLSSVISELSINHSMAVKALQDIIKKIISNVMSLRETTSKADETLREQLNELSENMLNQTHYDQLQSGIGRLESSKANQTDFEELVSFVVDVANSTVRTSDFLQLSRAVENNTTQLQKQGLQLVSKVATLEDTTSHINDLLATKADQHDVNSLSERIETLSDTTVQISTFETLQQTVETLESGKADQSELDELIEEIEHDINGLGTRITNHVTSAHRTHTTLTSDINDNDRDIQGNTHRITNIESDVQGLQAEETASVPGLTASWIITSSITAVVTVYT